MVHDGLGLDLVEGHAAEARGVEGARHRAALDERERHIAACLGEQGAALVGLRIGGRLVVKP